MWDPGEHCAWSTDYWNEHVSFVEVVSPLKKYVHYHDKMLKFFKNYIVIFSIRSFVHICQNLHKYVDSSLPPAIY